MRQLTDVRGGSVSVASAPGAGSTFTVRLPFAVVDPDVGSDAPLAAPIRRAGGSRA
jgi:hypothetical protein